MGDVVKCVANSFTVHAQEDVSTVSLREVKLTFLASRDCTQTTKKYLLEETRSTLPHTQNTGCAGKLSAYSRPPGTKTICSSSFSLVTLLYRNLGCLCFPSLFKNNREPVSRRTMVASLSLSTEVYVVEIRIQESRKIKFSGISFWSSSI